MFSAQELLGSYLGFVVCQLAFNQLSHPEDLIGQNARIFPCFHSNNDLAMGGGV